MRFGLSGGPVRYGDAGDVAADRSRRPDLGHGVDEGGDGLRLRWQRLLTARRTPLEENAEIGFHGPLGVAAETRSGRLGQSVRSAPRARARGPIVAPPKHRTRVLYTSERLPGRPHVSRWIARDKDSYREQNREVDRGHTSSWPTDGRKQADGVVRADGWWVVRVPRGVAGRKHGRAGGRTGRVYPAFPRDKKSELSRQVRRGAPCFCYAQSGQAGRPNLRPPKPSLPALSTLPSCPDPRARRFVPSRTVSLGVRVGGWRSPGRVASRCRSGRPEPPVAALYFRVVFKLEKVKWRGRTDPFESPRDPHPGERR